jgi:hypothetical protein
MLWARLLTILLEYSRQTLWLKTFSTRAAHWFARVAFHPDTGVFTARKAGKPGPIDPAL